MNILKRSTALALLAFMLQSNAVVYAAKEAKAPKGGKATEAALQVEIQNRTDADAALANIIEGISLTPGPAGPQGNTGAPGPAGPAGVDAPDRTADLCALYQILFDAGLIGAELTVPAYCVPPTTTYAIGDTGPAGGIVFHVTDGGLHGLEAAPVDQTFALWCSIFTDIVDVDNIASAATLDSHSGSHNTPLIVTDCGASSAAGVAANYAWPNGQSDGFLPNKEELNDMYSNIGQGAAGGNVGGFANRYYWSSSEYDSFDAWFQNFYIGTQYGTNKNVTTRVRAVRAF